ncbi:MAG: hypothetical protein Q4D02_05420 [Clostridia bacterium]|nr:hypothetical protein [Clostridia bacterium]
MEISRIRKKYCTEDKVQIMLSNAKSQIICSKDGYLYLRDGNITIHKYLTDLQRKDMPYHSRPSSKRHATHLFKYDQLYVKFTRSRAMNDSIRLDADSYTLSFLYFYKIGKGEAICAELFLDDFTKEEETIRIFSKKELEDFLYGVSSEIKGKYILEWFYGIRYAKSSEESISIQKKFLSLSDEDVTKLHNLAKEPIRIVNYFDKSSRKHCEDESWKANNIDEITEFSMTNYGFNFNYPIMIIITSNEVLVYEFEVICCKKDSFKVRSQRIRITPDLVNILTQAIHSDYPPEPSSEDLM